jgi:methyl-accepting chemotaxis protein
MAQGSWFAQRGIRSRILWMIFATSFIACGAVMVNYAAMTQQAQELGLQSSSVDRMVVLGDLISSVKTGGLAAMDAIVDAATGKVAKEVVSDHEAFRQYLGKNRTSLEDIGRDLGRRDETTKLLNSMTTLEAGVNTLFDRIRARTATAEVLADLDDRIDDAQNEASSIAQQLSGITRDQYHASAEKVRRISENSLKISVGANIVLLLTLFFLGISTANGITLSTRKSSQDLDSTVKALVTATSDLDRAGHTLAGTATEQNASVTETVSAMTEIQSVIRRSTDNSRSVVELAKEARVRSEEGSQIMTEMSRAMTAVKTANNELEKIVKIIQQIESKTNVVNNIAFKTQVLSFNASIEAARAGANGRGFAVVAMEVGRLADVSGKAAEEISALLRESVVSVSDTVERLSAKVTEATHTNSEAHQRFEKIVEDISAINGKITEIEHGIREQSSGVDQCVKAMRQLSIASQANDDLAKEISGLSGTMRHRSRDLELVAQAYNAVIEGRKNTKSVQTLPESALKKMAPESDSSRDVQDLARPISGAIINDDAIIDNLAAAAARLTQEDARGNENPKKMRKSA